jgi:hypothetical protein
LLPLVFSVNPDSEPPVRTRHHYFTSTKSGQNRGARLDDSEGKWFYKRPTTNVMELYNLAVDLREETNVVADYATIADLPANHPHRVRLEDMEAWYVAHNTAYGPRSEPARSYAPTNALSGPPRIVSVNFAKASADQQLIDADDSYGVPGEASVAGGWINLVQTASFTDLPFSNSESSTVDISVAAPAGWGTGNAAYNDTPLLGMVQHYTNTAGSAAITVSDLNASFPQGCKAIVYLTGFIANKGASITDGSTTYFYQALDDPTNQFQGMLNRTTQTNELGYAASPFAQYAVFGSDSNLLTANTLTISLNTLYGGGSGIGGIQLIGPAVAPPSETAKTPIPVPVRPLAGLIRANGVGCEIRFDGLESGVTYALEQAGSLTGPWQVIGHFVGTNQWATNVPVGLGANYFRAASPTHVLQQTLPLSP